MKTLMTLKTPKPRNPIVAPAMHRVAGSHRAGPGSQRQQAARRLRQEIERLRHGP
jgi:hypothetical protein